MNLGEKLQWLQQCQSGLMEFYHQSHPTLTHREKVGLCREIARLDGHIIRIKAMPEWAHQWGCDDVHVVEVSSGLNENVQGVRISTLRKLPKIDRTWTELR